jgi:V/A-type H+-transporting ATPase subunit F
MKKAAVMGDLESVYGFGALGFEVFAIDEPSEAVKKIKSLGLNDYSIIFITESLAAQISDEIKVFEEQLSPALIPIPGISGNTGLGTKNLQKLIEKAVGADIL